MGRDRAIIGVGPAMAHRWGVALARLASTLVLILQAAPSVAGAQGHPLSGPTPSNLLASRFDGIWMKDEMSRLRFSADPPLLPAALAKFKSLKPQDDPGARCVESGIGRMMIGPSPMEIVALGNHILLVSENFHTVRRIWTDLKAHSSDVDPGFYGESIVKWDGDTMVVDTIGLNGKNYLDSWGYPMSDAMHVVERWKLLNPDKLQIEYTFDDPKNYSHPWSSTFTYGRKSDFRLAEYSCTDNNRNNPDDPSADKNFTSSDKPAEYQERPAAPGR